MTTIPFIPPPLEVWDHKEEMGVGHAIASAWGVGSEYEIWCVTDGYVLTVTYHGPGVSRPYLIHREMDNDHGHLYGEARHVAAWIAVMGRMTAVTAAEIANETIS